MENLNLMQLLRVTLPTNGGKFGLLLQNMCIVYSGSGSWFHNRELWLQGLISIWRLVEFKMSVMRATEQTLMFCLFDVPRVMLLELPGAVKNTRRREKLAL